ncbi:hypothetical protein WJX72_011545 [[Myrmecia] bisecta]|uniref:Uncharacterized protein n=1 Tax=[Myrmecia] bisecta TaxID=41462 RepID=A0AAW1PMK4_9CHLO
MLRPNATADEPLARPKPATSRSASLIKLGSTRPTSAPKPAAPLQAAAAAADGASRVAEDNAASGPRKPAGQASSSGRSKPQKKPANTTPEDQKSRSSFGSSVDAMLGVDEQLAFMGKSKIANSPANGKPEAAEKKSRLTAAERHMQEYCE